MPLYPPQTGHFYTCLCNKIEKIDFHGGKIAGGGGEREKREEGVAS